MKRANNLVSYSYIEKKNLISRVCLRLLDFWSKARAYNLRYIYNYFYLLIKHLNWTHWLSLASMNWHNYNYICGVGAVYICCQVAMCNNQQPVFNLRFKSTEWMPEQFFFFFFFGQSIPKLLKEFGCDWAWKFPPIQILEWMNCFVLHTPKVNWYHMSHDITFLFYTFCN